MPGLLPLYLRREPTTDVVALAHCPPAQLARVRDVVAYRDRDCTRPAGRWPWWHVISKPRRGCRRVTLNCWPWLAIWLPDSPDAGPSLWETAHG